MSAGGSGPERGGGDPGAGGSAGTALNILEAAHQCFVEDWCWRSPGLSVRAADGSVRYVDLPDGAGQATVGSDEEVSLVVVNAPDELCLFDPEFIGAEPASDPANTALKHEVRTTGATPAG